jgi:hypothetical protein
VDGSALLLFAGSKLAQAVDLQNALDLHQQAMDDAKVACGNADNDDHHVFPFSWMPGVWSTSTLPRGTGYPGEERAATLTLMMVERSE